MQYITYRLSGEQLGKFVRRHKLAKVRPNHEIKDALAYMYAEAPAMLQTMELFIHAEEFHWIDHGKNIVFIESTEIGNKIKGANFGRLENTDSMIIEPDSFMLALPNDFILGGKKVGSGIMVNIIKHEDRESEVVWPFLRAIKQPPLNLMDTFTPDEFGISVLYQEKMSMEVMRMCLSASNFLEALNCETPEEYGKYMDEINEFNYLGGVNLDAPETSYQFDIVKLIAGFLVYRMALPERIHDGFPDKVNPKKVTSTILNNVKGKVIKAPDASRTLLHRDWHFRQLRHEKYYQNEHASKPRGSRVVFVTEYNDESVTAKTAKGTI